MVASFTQLLARRYRGTLDADADEFIGHITDGAKRMGQLIDDLLMFSRVGTRDIALRPTETQGIVNRAIANLGAAIQECGAIVTCDDLPSVIGEPTLMAQLFQNLIGNAIKYRGDRTPEIFVHAERGDGEWLFSIRDNGIGIDPKFGQRIFVIFQRLHGRGEYPGTGIGLAVCKRIVERHGGRIWVESQPGAGSTFYFTIPDRAEEQAA